ncbi:MAG: hydrogenase maturation protease [Planctomycetota bacterium]
MAELIEEIRAALEGRRAVLLGVGTRMRADDGFGPMVIDLLGGRAACALMDCGSAPENFAGKVKGLQPQVVLVLDAAHFGGDPGELRLVAGGAAGGGGLSTHAAGLNMLFDYLRRECGAEGWLLACQPAGVELGGEMSPAVRAAAARAADLLAEALADDA